MGKRKSRVFDIPVLSEALIQSIDTVRKNTKKADLLCWLGGEEFVILVTSEKEIEFEHIAERLRQVLESHEIQTAGHAFYVVASFGVAYIRAESAAVENAVNDADKALYEAKHIDRNCVVVSRPTALHM